MKISSVINSNLTSILPKYYKENIYHETGIFFQLQVIGNAIIIHWQTNWQLNYLEKNRYVKNMDGSSRKA